MVGKLRKVSLEVLKKAFHAYCVNAVSSMLDHVYCGRVSLTLNGAAMGKPFQLNTDTRAKETLKHSERYIDDFLSSVNENIAKLQPIIKSCNDVLLTKAKWDIVLQHIREAIEQAATRFTVYN